MRRIITRSDAERLNTKAQERQQESRPGGDEAISVSPFGGAPPGSPPGSFPSSGGHGALPPAGGLVPDDYLTRLQKLIPAEVVAAFLAIDGIIQQAGKEKVSDKGYWIIFGVLILLCLGYARKMTRVAGLPVDHMQVLVATFAFVVWTYAIGGPFEYASVDWWNQALGGVMVILYTAAAPLLVR
jgi:hypothetical protein